MNFVGWPSIENTYRDEFITHFLAEFPALATETFVLTEKLHGSCLTIAYAPDGEIRVGSRRQWIDASGTFQGTPILPLLQQPTIERAKRMAGAMGQTIRLFGELIGPKIQKGVNYGKEKRILFFGLMIDDILQPTEVLLKLVERDALVPVVASGLSLQEALDFNTEFQSLLTPPDFEGDNLCEGIVIVPDHVYRSAGGSTFMLKKKNEAFKEKQKTSKLIVIDDEVSWLNQEFRAYITDQRLQSVFSKYGKIEKPQQIGDYIRYMLDDARSDFLKDFQADYDALDDKQKRQALNVGSTIAKMLQENL